jgi:hypothetical protein
VAVVRSVRAPLVSANLAQDHSGLFRREENSTEPAPFLPVAQALPALALPNSAIHRIRFAHR